MEKIKPGKYRHYKGNLYEVIGVGRHTETKEELVVYRAIYDDGAWSGGWNFKPLGNFLEKVVVNGDEIPRFKRVEDKR